MSCLKGGNNEKEKALAKLAHRDQENQVINEVVFTREMAKRKVRILNLEKDKLLPHSCDINAQPRNQLL